MMRVLALGVLVAACGGGDDAATADAPPGSPDAGGDPGRVIGGVQVVEERGVAGDPPQEYRSGRVSARFFDPAPPNFHRVADTEGACTLLRYAPSNCDPVCTDGLCVEGACEAWPGASSAGTLTITGLTTSVSITPVDGGYYGDAVPDELFADDATITAQLAGDDLPAGELTAGGVPAIEPDIEAKIVLETGADHTITWTAGGGGRVVVTLNSNNQGHGGPYLGIITCDVADAAGEVTIPAALIDQFPETRAWTICAGTDCPPSSIARYRAATRSIGGDRAIELRVASTYYFGVDHLLVDQ